MKADECIQVAQLFSGGFMGWSQHHDVPIRLTWAVDSNLLCSRSFEAQHQGAQTVGFEDG